MNKFEVSLQGMFRKEYFINANTMEEAEEQARNLFNKEIGLLPDDYCIDSVTTIPEDI